MVTGEDVLAVAAREIGYHESKDKHNKYGEWFGLDYAPWCLEFCQWVYHQCGMDLPFATASCGQLLQWYREHQPDCITKKPIAGALVIFDFPNTKYTTDHVGLFVKADRLKITTIDGNTSNGNDSNGGWVQQRTRTWGYASPTFIIPRGLVEVDWDKAIKDLTGEQAYKLYCKAVNYMVNMPLPTSWNAKEEWDEAIKMGITHGDAPMRPSSLLETAVMVKRAKTLAN